MVGVWLLDKKYPRRWAISCSDGILWMDENEAKLLRDALNKQLPLSEPVEASDVTKLGV